MFVSVYYPYKLQDQYYYAFFFFKIKKLKFTEEKHLAELSRLISGRDGIQSQD